MELIPAGDYVFSIVKASYAERDPNEISVSAAIESEGDVKGRRVFFGYPDPAKREWSPKAFKRLVIALGSDILEGEDPVAYLNRNLGGIFGAPIKHEQEKNIPDGSTEPRTFARLQTFSVRPAVK